MASQQSQADVSNEQANVNNSGSANDNVSARNNASTNDNVSNSNNAVTNSNASANNNGLDNGGQEILFQQALLTSRRDLARTYTCTLQDVNTDISALIQESNTIIQQTLQRNNVTLRQVMQRIDESFNRMTRDVDANDEALLRNFRERLTSPSVAPPLRHNYPYATGDEPDHPLAAPEVVQPRDARRSSRGAGPSPSSQREDPEQHVTQRGPLIWHTQRPNRNYMRQATRSQMSETGGHWMYDSTGEGSSEHLAHIHPGNQEYFENNPHPSAEDVHWRRQASLDLGLEDDTADINIHWVDDTDPDDWFERDEPDPAATQHAANSDSDTAPRGSRSREDDPEQPTQIDPARIQRAGADDSRGSVPIKEVRNIRQDTSSAANPRNRKGNYELESAEKNVKSRGVDKKPEDNPGAILGGLDEPRRTRNSKTPGPAHPSATRRDSTRPLSATNSKDPIPKSKSTRKRGQDEKRVDETFAEAQVNHSKRSAASQEPRRLKRQKLHTEHDNDDPAVSTRKRSNAQGKQIKEEIMDAFGESSSGQRPLHTGASPDTFARTTANVPDDPTWSDVMQATTAGLGRRAPTVTNSEGAHRYFTQR